MSSTVVRPGLWYHVVLRWLVPIVLIYLALLTALLLFGKHWTPPDDKRGATTADGGMQLATQALIGRNVTTDLLIDYASAHALTHDKNAYLVSSTLIHGVGPDWPVSTPNPHPPTVLALMLPLMLVRYHIALAAWSLAMIFALVGTLLVLEVPFRYAVPLGLVLGLTFPGAAGITNVVPVIGLGVAVAYRWRYTPVVAGLGIALAAAPKSSGLVLVIPFLLAGRLRTVGWAALWYGLVAALPLVFDRHVWSRYLVGGVDAIRKNAARKSNGSLLNWSGLGLSSTGIVVAIILLTVVLILLRRDLYWPLVWATVALLPIAWMYSALTLVPMIVWLTRRNLRRSGSLAACAAAIGLAVAPLGPWGVFGFRASAVLAFIFLLCADPLEPDERLYVPRMLDPLRGRGPWDIGAIPHQLAGKYGVGTSWQRVPEPRRPQQIPAEPAADGDYADGSHSGRGYLGEPDEVDLDGHGRHSEQAVRHPGSGSPPPASTTHR